MKCSSLDLLFFLLKNPILRNLLEIFLIKRPVLRTFFKGKIIAEKKKSLDQRSFLITSKIISSNTKSHFTPTCESVSKKLKTKRNQNQKSSRANKLANYESSWANKAAVWESSLANTVPEQIKYWNNNKN